LAGSPLISGHFFDFLAKRVARFSGFRRLIGRTDSLIDDINAINSHRRHEYSSDRASQDSKAVATPSSTKRSALPSLAFSCCDGNIERTD
jgi:hypothetical protein